MGAASSRVREQTGRCTALWATVPTETLQGGGGGGHVRLAPAHRRGKKKKRGGLSWGPEHGTPTRAGRSPLNPSRDLQNDGGLRILGVQTKPNMAEGTSGVATWLSCKKFRLSPLGCRGNDQTTCKGLMGGQKSTANGKVEGWPCKKFPIRWLERANGGVDPPKGRTCHAHEKGEKKQIRLNNLLYGLCTTENGVREKNEKNLNNFALTKGALGRGSRKKKGGNNLTADGQSGVC